jgi:hypothetical protein
MKAVIARIFGLGAAEDCAAAFDERPIRRRLAITTPGNTLPLNMEYLPCAHVTLLRGMRDSGWCGNIREDDAF